ncbi:TPA: hypothetical protein DEF17_05200 [bacterium]|nr:hypothetical protein [bacterium]
MEKSSHGPQFLKEKYDLHNAPEVEHASSRTEKQTGEKVSQDPRERIQNYLDRFTEIVECKEPAKRERGIEALKKVMHDQFVIKPEEIPEGCFEAQQRLAREQGHGDIEISEEMREQLTEVIITDQKGSLDQWIDYLSSEDATYPDWLKYFAFRSVLGLGEYDKEKKQFSKRSKGTVKPFPDINREALAYVLDAVEKKTKKENVNIQTQTEEEKEEFEKLLQGENFAKLYAFAIDKVTPASESALTNTKGEWVKYRQGRDHTPLVNSLQGHGTGWCTAGESTAQAQLANGDFYVYYSLDENGKPNIPRAAIRMQNDSIAEVRGIAHEQNLDPYIGEVVGQKMKGFPDGQAYEKKSADMKLLTEIENKINKKQELTKEDLTFLYEIDSNIEGFGYERDPRIEEIRSTRIAEEDAPIFLECSPTEIAWGQEEISESTKAYIGPLFPDIFTKFSYLESIYTSFPEGKISRQELEIGGKNVEQLEREMREKGINISDYAEDMLKSQDFTTTQNPEEIDLVHLKVGDLGLPGIPTTDQIYARAEELGLELCPAEVGPLLRLKDSEQPLGEWYRVAMKQIADRRGYPNVFNLERDGGGLWLRYCWADPGDRWGSGNQFVFRSRKVSHES